MSNRFAEMDLSSFCNYVSCNPGGAMKAYELRKRGGGDMGGGKERVVYRDKVVEKRVEVPVDREVLVEKVVRKTPRLMYCVSGVMFCLWMLATAGYHAKEVNPEVIKEVPVEVVKEVKVPVVKEVIKEVPVVKEVKVPVEVVKEVEVIREVEDTSRLDEYRMVIRDMEQEIDELHGRLRNARRNRRRRRSHDMIGGVINGVIQEVL